MVVCCLFKQTTAYAVRISDWSSDVCSADPPDERTQRNPSAALSRREDDEKGGLRGIEPVEERSGAVQGQHAVRRLEREGDRAGAGERHRHAVDKAERQGQKRDADRT